MSLEEILTHLETLGYVVMNPRTQTLTVQRKWYEVKKYNFPGIKNVEELATSYRNLWPAGIKTGNLYVKAGLHSIIEKLRTFLKLYPSYTDEIILEATRRYIAECSRDNYQYMKTADYFILKNRGSALETYCQAVLDNEEDVSTAHSNLRVG